MSLLGKFLLAFAISIVVLLISVASAYKLIDDSVIQENALNALKNALNRDVSVGGRFTLSRTLHPTLQASDIRIASADWDQDSYFIKADEIEFSVDLLDLLRGVITIDSFKFNDAIINLKRSNKGQSNLDFSDTQQNTDTQKKTGGALPSRIVIKSFEVKNLLINYSDEEKNRQSSYSFDSFDIKAIDEETIKLTTISLLDGQPMELQSEMCRLRSLLQGDDCKLSADIISIPFESKVEGIINIAGEGKPICI